MDVVELDKTEHPDDIASRGGSPKPSAKEGNTIIAAER